jgi:hypothetical protein
MRLHRVPLEVLRIENPCPADWSAMAGDDQRRFCQGCQKHVHNLSAMLRSDAEALVCAAAGDLCVRMQIDPDGTVVTVDYQGSTRTRPRRGWQFWTGVGLVGALLAGVAQAMGVGRPRPAVGVPAGMVMGGPPAATFPAGMFVAGGICPPPFLPTTQPTTNPSSQPSADPQAEPPSPDPAASGPDDPAAAAR